MLWLVLLIAFAGIEGATAGLISIWFLYRIVRGMVAMNKGQAIDV